VFLLSIQMLGPGAQGEHNVTVEWLCFCFLPLLFPKYCGVH